MALLPILLAPHPTLSARANPVEGVDDHLRKLSADMLETMYEAPGIGLAANQIGRLERVLVMDCQRDPEGEPMPRVMFNPEIIWKSDEISANQEGCLSIPEQFADIDRPSEVKVRYLDTNGSEREDHLTDLEARCVQHEIDHLDGILFWDHVSQLKRNIIKRKLAKLKKERARDETKTKPGG